MPTFLRASLAALVLLFAGCPGGGTVASGVGTPVPGGVEFERELRVGGDQIPISCSCRRR